MATFVYWNLKNRDLSSLVADLALERQADFVVLAEAKRVSRKLLPRLNRGEANFYSHPTPAGNAPVEIFATLGPDHVIPFHDSGRLTFRLIRPPDGLDFLFVGAHLNSKLHAKREDQAQLCTEWSQEIQEIEDRVGHQRTVFVGDLNMNPFEDGLVGGFGFHAVSTRARAARRRRTINGRPSRCFFYNPMWRFMGGSASAPGTYHRISNSPIEHFWHTFDQVLIRPDLLESFPDSGLNVITEINGKSLLTRNGVPSTTVASDHLPIQFELHFERKTDDRSESVGGTAVG